MDSVLSDLRAIDCNSRPLEEFVPSSKKTGKYIRFRFQSVLTGGGGLNHISWECKLLFNKFLPAHSAKRKRRSISAV